MYGFYLRQIHTHYTTDSHPLYDRFTPIVRQIHTNLRQDIDFFRKLIYDVNR